MSPTNLSSVPLCANTMSTMRVKYSFSMPTISSGCAASRRRSVKPRMSEKSTVISRRWPPSRASAGIRDELLVDVLRDVLAEQLLHLPLLAPLDEVLIADAAEQRERRGEHRLRQVQPVAAGEQPRGDPAHSAATRTRPSPRSPTTPAAASRPGRRRAPAPTTVRDADAARLGLADEAVRQDVVGDRGVDLDARHLAVARTASRTRRTARPRSRRRTRSCRGTTAGSIVRLAASRGSAPPSTADRRTSRSDRCGSSDRRAAPGRGS